MSSTKEGPSGLGGWLVLVFIGLVLSMLRIVSLLLGTHAKLVLDGTLSRLSDPANPGYDPMWMPLITFEVIGNLAMLALIASSLILLLMRSRYAPRVVIGMYAFNVALVAGDLLLGQLIEAVAAQPLDTDSLVELARGVLTACIWIPYFLVSVRVRNTFIAPWPWSKAPANPATPPPLPSVEAQS